MSTQFIKSSPSTDFSKASLKSLAFYSADIQHYLILHRNRDTVIYFVNKVMVEDSKDRTDIHISSQRL